MEQPQGTSPDVRSLDDRQVADLYLDLAFPPGTARPYTVLNTVVSLDGKTTRDGRSTAIGSALDRVLLRRVRAAAEGVIVAAGTLRAEEIEFRFPPELQARRAQAGLPAAFVVVIVSARGELPLQRRLFSSPTPEITPVVLTTQRADPAALERLAGRARVLVVGAEEVDLPRAMAMLTQDFGVRRLVLEGGASFNAAMLGADLVDEIFCTLAPLVLGGPALTMVAGPGPLRGGPRRLALLSALDHGGELYLRYRVSHDARPSR